MECSRLVIERFDFEMAENVLAIGREALGKSRWAVCDGLVLFKMRVLIF